MYINVLIENKVKTNDMTFTYHVPYNLEDNNLIGKRVLVPFAKREIQGFVLSYTNDVSSKYEIKDIISVLDGIPVLNNELLKLGKYMSEKYLCSLIYCYQVMLPSFFKANHNTKVSLNTKTYVKLNKEYDVSLIKTEKQRKIIDYIKEKKEVLKNEIESKSILKKLIDNNIILEYKKEVYRDINISYSKKNIELTKEQLNVSNSIKNNFNKSKTILLYGVTGSGKTEVYIDVVKDVIKNKKTAIILVPEISLTPQITSRFKSVFKDDIAILHSSLSDGERYDEYRKIKNNEVSVVIGARSAVFAPLENIGIIIIDEEHSESYKQDNNPRYNTLDIARKRGEFHNCPVLIASATPTIESFARAKKGYYEYVELTKRVNEKPMPKVTIVDMKKEVRKNNPLFSSVLLEKIKNRLEKKEQILLLLNRRGYSNYLTCINCGFTYKCPNCDITLTYHKTSGMLRCHYCGYATNKLEVCPDCKEKSIRQMGTGTEKIEEEIKKIFNCKVLRMDRDTTGKKGAHDKLIKEFESNNYDILVGTQMISKGLNFPNVTLVGVISADQSLNIPNYKSSENTYSLLDQVIGRAGRHDKAGEAVIQTFNENHYSIICASKHDYVGFYNIEMQIRKKLNYPPYCFICLIKITSKDFNYGINEAKKISIYLKNNLKSTIVLGPSMANVLRINNNYNFQVILKYKRDDSLYNVLNDLIKIYEGNSKIKVELDFNPINL